jgi:hypothetical protein
MQTYNGFLVYFRQRPFINIIDDSQQNVEQFKLDYCASQRIPYVPDEWIVYPLKSIIARSTLNKLAPVAATMSGAEMPSSPYYAKEGYVKVKLNPRTWD